MVKNTSPVVEQTGLPEKPHWVVYLAIALVSGAMGLFSFFLAIFSVNEFVVAVSIGTSVVIFFMSLALVSFGKVTTAFVISVGNVFFFLCLLFALNLAKSVFDEFGRAISKIDNPFGADAALDRGVRDGVLRKASQDDLSAWRDVYLANKYTSKGLALNPHDDAMIGAIDLTKAYWVVGKFVLPWGKGGTNRSVFFVPKNVPYPVGELGMSAIYDFETLLVTCAGARTQAFSC